MLTTKTFPCVLMVLDVFAAAGYAWHKDYMRAGYWLSAAAITFFATWSH